VRPVDVLAAHHLPRTAAHTLLQFQESPLSGIVSARFP